MRCVATCTEQHVTHGAISMIGRIVFREEKCSRVTGNIDREEEIRNRNKWSVLLRSDSSLRIIRHQIP